MPATWLTPTSRSVTRGQRFGVSCRLGGNTGFRLLDLPGKVGRIARRGLDADLLDLADAQETQHELQIVEAEIRSPSGPPAR